MQGLGSVTIDSLKLDLSAAHIRLPDRNDRTLCRIAGRLHPSESFLVPESAVFSGLATVIEEPLRPSLFDLVASQRNFALRLDSGISAAHDEVFGRLPSFVKRRQRCMCCYTRRLPATLPFSPVEVSRELKQGIA